MQGHKGQLAPRCRALDAMIKKLYHGIQNAIHPFRFTNFEHLGSGGNHNLRPGCRRPPARTFHTPVHVGTLRLDAPALFQVRSPIDGNKLESS